MQIIHLIIKYLTDFADQAVVIPTFVGILAGLCVLRWWRGAAALASIVTLTFGAILLLKLEFAACRQIALETNIFSPSGHVAAAAALSGALAIIVWGRHSRRLLIATGCAAAAALTIGITRVVLHHHTDAEVFVAVPVGVAGAVLMSLLAGRPAAQFQARPIVGVSFLIMIALNGMHLQAEPIIREAGRALDCHFD